MPSERGQTAIAVPVPAADPVVSKWRERLDDSAAQGMGAHITILYPFLPEDRLTDEVLARLRALCAELPVLAVEFRRTARFSDLLYLDPEPADGLRHLTALIARQWPEAPPYGGSFSEVIPHLTVAYGVGDSELNRVDADVQRGLPFSTQLMEARLGVFDGVLWRPRARLPFSNIGRRSAR